MRSLDGKTGLITGSTSGLGAGLAQAMAARGANIILNALLSSACHTIRLALVAMKAKQWGRIINIASAPAEEMLGNSPWYEPADPLQGLHLYEGPGGPVQVG